MAPHQCSRRRRWLCTSWGARSSAPACSSPPCAGTGTCSTAALGGRVGSAVQGAQPPERPQLTHACRFPASSPWRSLPNSGPPLPLSADPLKPCPGGALCTLPLGLAPLHSCLAPRCRASLGQMCISELDSTPRTFESLVSPSWGSAVCLVNSYLPSLPQRHCPSQDWLLL